MGAEFVEAIVSGFSEGGLGLATGMLSAFDAVTKTAEGGLTNLAQVGLTLGGFGLFTGFIFGLVRKFSHKV